MTDLLKFYKLALNILEHEPKETICYDGELALFKVHLGDDPDYALEFYTEDKEIRLQLNMFHALHSTPENLRDLDNIIKTLKDNKTGNLLLEGIE